MNYTERWGHRGRDRTVFGFTTTSVISVYHHKSCKFESHLRQYDFLNILKTNIPLRFKENTINFYFYYINCWFTRRFRDAQCPVLYLVFCEPLTITFCVAQSPVFCALFCESMAITFRVAQSLVFCLVFCESLAITFSCCSISSFLCSVL